MSDKKLIHIVLITTIINGKHLPAGSTVDLTEEDASRIGEKFVKLAKVAVPADKTTSDDAAAQKAAAEKAAADVAAKTAAAKTAAKTK